MGCRKSVKTEQCAGNSKSATVGTCNEISIDVIAEDVQNKCKSALKNSWWNDGHLICMKNSQYRTRSGKITSKQQGIPN
jgi:hypothetical protein